MRFAGDVGGGTGTMTVVVALALGASLANALTSVFQRQALETAPAEARLRLQLLTYALRRRTWLAGFAMMIVSFAFQAVALHLGRLSEVQPILTTELVFLVAVLAAWYGFDIRRREWLGVLAVSGGLAGFLYFADPVEGTLSPPPGAWIATAVACGGVACLATMLALRGPRWWRAGMFGTAASVTFAFTAACTKVVSLAVMFAGAFWLSHSPLVSGMKGGDQGYRELLSQRSRSARVAAPACPCPPPAS